MGGYFLFFHSRNCFMKTKGSHITHNGMAVSAVRIFYEKIILMTNTEKQIWKLVHEWCNEQSCEIPDFNRRALMERILALRQPHVSGQSEQCNHVFQRVERGGEFQGNQCECGEWEDLT